MFKFLLKRILSLIPVLIGVTLIASFLVYIIPGDPATSMAGEAVNPEILQKIRDHYGLDKPFIHQYFIFLKRVVTFDFGESFITGDNIGEVILERLPNTFILAISAMIYASVLGVFIGVVSALNRNTWIDRLAQYFLLLGISTPVFFLGLILIFIFSVKLKLFSGTGFNNIYSLILPAITLGTQSAAIIARITRSTILDVLPLDHVRFAKAKGLSYHKIILKHVLYNSSIPILTMIVLDLGSYLNGSVITETIFGWPGIGSYIFYDGIMKRDFPVIQAVVFLGALIFLLANLLTDIIYFYLDPRLKSKIDSM